MLENLTTEKRNEKTLNLDKMTAIEFCTVMNEEDGSAISAVQREIPQIAKAIDLVVSKMRKGGRLVYIGAGTSGRMGLMDAVECVPTFGLAEGVVIGRIAGGNGAFIKAVEGAEDSKELGAQDLENIALTDQDIVIGIAASGRTPYVIGGLDYANSIHAATIALSCNKGAEISKHAGHAIEVDTGSEVLTGSTRLKAGTAQKLVLNMISTGAMVQSGKVYKNLMVDVLMTNEKLRERGKYIVMEATGADYATAQSYLQKSGNKVKTAIVMILKNCSKEEAEKSLEDGNGMIEKAIQS